MNLNNDYGNDDDFTHNRVASGRPSKTFSFHICDAEMKTLKKISIKFACYSCLWLVSIIIHASMYIQTGTY